jgi:hypothetical protein
MFLALPLQRLAPHPAATELIAKNGNDFDSESFDIDAADHAQTHTPSSSPHFADAHVLGRINNVPAKWLSSLSAQGGRRSAMSRSGGGKIDCSIHLKVTARRLIDTTPAFLPR